MFIVAFVVVQSLSHVWLFATPWTAASQTSLSFSISWTLLKFISVESVMPSNHLFLCYPLLFLPSVFPSIRVLYNESAVCIRWLKYLSFSFSISPSSEYSGLILFRIDWFDLLPVHGTPKSLLQHHISKASVLQCSAFFMVQLSHPYMTIGKTTALPIWTFVSKVMSLLFVCLFVCFLLKDNCFTEYCCFLSNLNMNQPEVYISPLTSEPPSHLPPLEIDTEPLSEFSEPYREFPLAIYFTYGNVM